MRHPIALYVAAATAATGLMVVGPRAAAVESCSGLSATIVGAGAITGTPGNDVIVGSEGPDAIMSGAGNDVVCAGGGGDDVSDGSGKDRVYLEAGDDTAIADPARDKGDVVDGGAGSDTADYSARTGALRIKLATMFADDGAAGETDKLLAVENAIGGAGDDTIMGTDGDNALSGNGGNDTITDLLGADVVAGGPGDDKVVQGKATDAGDQLDGGDGVDEISYAARPATSGGTVIDLSGSETSGTVAADEGDVLSAFEDATGGIGQDFITGTDDANVIAAGNGLNVVHAQGGNDTITTGTKPDLVDDGPGTDVVSTGGSCDVVRQREYDAGDVLDGGSGACDEIDYSDRTDDLVIDLGVTTAANGGAGEADALSGFEDASGGDGDDVLKGTGVANWLRGGVGYAGGPSGDGNDILIGLGGADVLQVFDLVLGNDSVDGGTGSDYCDLDPADTAVSCEDPHVWP